MSTDSSRPTARILIVDDEPEIVRALSLRLRAAGYEVLSAADAIQATQAAMKERPDLVILDIGMPCGDGHTVASRIRSSSLTSQTPIIFLSARTAHQDQERAREAGAVGFLTKPYKPEELLDLVKKALYPGDPGED